MTGGRFAFGAAGLALAVMALSLTSCSPGGDVPVVKAKKGMQASQPFRFAGKKGHEADIRRSVSGMACHDGGKASGLCLVVFDEGSEARLATLTADGFAPLAEQVKLADTDGELDVEGAAVGGDYFYVTGSHARKRRDCAANPDSRTVIRFRAAPSTGRPAVDSQSGGLVERKAVDSLWTALAANPEIGPYVDKCLGTLAPKRRPDLIGDHGLNIEGLAYADGRLYFGLRGPTVDRRARIVSVDADALFDKPADQLKIDVQTVELGYERGVRDMTAVKGGFLLLVGPDDDRPKGPPPFGFVFWDGKTTKKLADINLVSSKRDRFEGCKDKSARPEALAVREETDKKYKVVVLSDSLCDGGPTWLDVPR